MEFLIVIIVLIFLLGIMVNVKKAKRYNKDSSRTRSSHSGTNTTDFMSTGAIVSLQDTDRDDCSDTTSNDSDSSDGSSCD